MALPSQQSESDMDDQSKFWGSQSLACLYIIHSKMNKLAVLLLLVFASSCSTIKHAIGGAVGGVQLQRLFQSQPL